MVEKDLTAIQLADEFSKVEGKDLTVVEVRIRSLPRFLQADFGMTDHKDGKTFIWKARVIIDRRLKKGQLVLKVEKALASVTPKKTRLIKVTIY